MPLIPFVGAVGCALDARLVRKRQQRVVFVLYRVVMTPVVVIVVRRVPLLGGLY